VSLTGRLRRVVLVSYSMLSLVYIQAVLGGQDVSTVPIATRTARDALLAILAIVLWLRTAGARNPLPMAKAHAVLASACFVLIATRDISGQSVTFIRYFIVVPILGASAARALITELGPQKALVFFARFVAAIATISAGVGMLQGLGLLNSGPYIGYVSYGFVRSTGIVGQPNNQAFLLVLGLISARHAAQLRPRGLAVLTPVLGAGIVLTFSRTGIIALALVLLSPALSGRSSWIKAARRPVAVIAGCAIILGIPVFVGLRGGTGASIANDQRVEFVSRSISDLGVRGLIFGRPDVRGEPTAARMLRNGTEIESQSAYVTDNLYLDLAVIGGIGFLLAWIAFFLHLWRATRNSMAPTIGRSCILLLCGFGLTASAFGLFPGVLFLWTLLFIAVSYQGSVPPQTGYPAYARIPGARTTMYTHGPS
jgi:hypothetical protein